MKFKESNLENLPSDWKVDTMENSLSEIIDYRGKTPKKSKSGIVTLSAKSVKNGYIDYSNAYYISEETYKKFMTRGFPKKGDILLTTEAPLGYVAKLDRDKVAIAQRVLTLRGNEKYLINDYLRYYLMSSIGQYQLKSRETGTTVTGIKQSEFRKVIIFIPSIEEQKSIAHILSTLDEKIELNNQINKTLESIAQEIFKHWFVDFEFPNKDGKPYKSSGGEMVKSEMGMIPKKWKTGKFIDFIDTILGGDWGKESLQGNYKKKVYCLRGADIPEVRCGNKGKLPKRYILEKNYKNKKLNSGDLVIEISGGSPTQSTGRITYITQEMFGKYDADFVCTNFCRAITLKNKDYMEYFFFYWQKLYDQNVFFQYENGTTGIKNFDINTFICDFDIIKPSKECIEKFSIFARAIIKKIQINGDENIKLSEIRDSILPKLMSGEIRVPIDN
ncbi:restriction endonuclease subunit S [Clostridium guangxiense]|uniref:restriction endonuclease subunit S n=1 Tax=Clostridium guangxiense TaxID=1662055 RepID=UPI001E297581|nr:restriction endonuclease subunit S [Clostridium guangxiense]MCD2348249.1 restriction endonuclease subunit S [Clostridium guangxiense]